MKSFMYIIGLIILLGVGLIGMQRHFVYQNFEHKYIDEQYSEILGNTTSQSPEMLHNYGETALTSFFYSGLGDLELLKQANLYYSGSLKQGENEKTRYKYNLTKDLLNELLLPQQQDSQEETQGESQQGDGETDEQREDGQGGESETGNQGARQNGRDSEYFLGEENPIQPLSNYEQGKLDKAVEQLKNDQMRNQQYYGKQPQISPFQEGFDNFFGDIDRGGEKDW